MVIYNKRFERKKRNYESTIKWYCSLSKPGTQTIHYHEKLRISEAERATTVGNCMFPKKTLVQGRVIQSWVKITQG